MSKVVIKNLNMLGGEPVFRGTQVPFQALIDHLEGGDTLDGFLEQHPSVSSDLALAALDEVKSLFSSLRAWTKANH